MKKYKLLKDLPDLKAGAIFKDLTIFESDENEDYDFTQEELESFPDWFELVNTQFKPDNHATYYFINSQGHVCNAIWFGVYVDKERLEFGNCFQYLPDAVEKRDKIKEEILLNDEKI